MTRTNPYGDGAGTWLRGSFHGHCTENSACSSVPLETSVRMYHEVGAGFVTLTDHDVITDLTEIRRAYPDLVFIPGFEYSSRENLVFAGPDVTPLYEAPLERAVGRAGDLLTFVAHPKRRGDAEEYWSLSLVESLDALPDGTEVYNGHYGIPSALEKGRWPLYADFWDEILTAGHRLWGFANDDFHDPDDFGNAFNMVLAEERSPEGVISAAKAGRCYASTGLLLDTVSVSDSTITVALSSEGEGRFVGPGGEVLSKAEGRAFAYTAGDEAYVRFEAEGEDGRLWLQPMFAA